MSVEQQTKELRALEIYQAALELEENLKTRFIRDETAGNPELSELVHALLVSAKKADEQGFLQKPALAGSRNNLPEAYSASHEREPLPTTIGPYIPVKLIGEGGFGQVYLAEQTQPVSRLVALKLIKSELTNSRFIKRFEAERQMLALLNHPNIAQMYDAGTTDHGKPYFVMEYIEGISITRYCDENKMNLRQRLDLFLQVCRAIQHAHQKGVIHRDIKPANVLVSDQDGTAIPKVIDFGIAKALDLERNNITVANHTEFFGSPAYMSPEQIEQSELDVDTRSDVYGLGILLYELLAGSTPFAEDVSLITLMHEVVSQEPTRPSEKLAMRSSAVLSESGLGDKVKLIKNLQIDLDWIILRALEKSRESRYESPAAFAADINRYLSKIPVLARAPSLSYQTKKFISRHTAAVMSSAAVLIVIFFGIIGTTSGYYSAKKESAKAKSAEISAQLQAESAKQTIDLLQEFLSAADPGVKGRELKVVELLDAFKSKLVQLDDQPVIQASLMFTYAKTYFGLGLFNESRQYVNNAIEVQAITLGTAHPDYLSSQILKIQVLLKLGEYSAAEKWGRQAMEEGSLIDSRLALDAASVTADALKELGRYSEAADLHRDTYHQRQELLGEDHIDTVYSMARLAVALGFSNRLAESTELNRKVLQKRTILLGIEHPDTLNTMNNLAFSIGESGHLEEAERLHRITYEKRLQVLGADHSDSQTSLSNLAWTLGKLGRYEEAEKLNRESITVLTRVLGVDHPDTLSTMGNLANTLKQLGRLPEAKSLLQTVWQRRHDTLGPNHTATLVGLRDLADVLVLQGRYQEAKVFFEDLLVRRRHTNGRTHPATLQSMNRLARVLTKLEEYDAAVVLQQE